jgi:O-acetylserine/cysteine efflux transporter
MKPKDILIAVLVVTIWGSNFAAMRFGVMELPPLFVLALRHGIAALALVWFIGPFKGQFWQILTIAVLMGVLHFGTLLIGMGAIEAGTGSITMQICVPIGALLAWLIHGEKLGWGRAAGMVIAFAGILVIAGTPKIGDRLDMFLVLLASAVFFVLANIAIKRLGPVNPLHLNGWVVILSAPISLIASLIFETGQLPALMATDWQTLASIAYMALAVSFVGHGLWYYLLPRYETNQTMPFILLVPVMGVVFGVLALGESVTWQLLAGGIVTIIGVAVITTRGATLKRETL